LWESAAADRDGIVAGAHSAEVALATKAGSHSHKGNTSLPNP
jgi:hypothetical protein